MVTPIYTPCVFLRCKRCGEKTGHVWLKTIYSTGDEAVEETYECQECGETKTIYELAHVLNFPRSCKLTYPTTARAYSD